jgi:hypothetical protein
MAVLCKSIEASKYAQSLLTVEAGQIFLERLKFGKYLSNLGLVKKNCIVQSPGRNIIILFN